MPSIMKTVQVPGKPSLSTSISNGAGASAQQQPAAGQPSLAPAGAWQTVGSTNKLKSALASARGGPSLAPRKTVVMAPIPQSPSALASNMNNLALNPALKSWTPANNAPYNPSMGPTVSAMTTKYRQTIAPSTTTGHQSHPGPIRTAVCVSSGYSRRDFRLGDVISTPYHTPNQNPNVDPSDFRLSYTTEGPAYSKRRMMVALFLHQSDMYALPLYSFSGRGLAGKPPHLRSEYVCLKNAGQENFVNEGVYEPLEIQAHRPVTDSTTVHVTGGVKVGYNEDIARVGRLTEKSYFNLVDVWGRTVQQARREPWR